MTFHPTPLHLAFETFGSGSNLLLCFPGFGRRAHEFSKWEKSLGKHYTLVAIDHIGLGDSTYSVDPIKFPIDTTTWKVAIQSILSQFNHDKFSLLGYSLGGRLAMWTYSIMHSQIEDLKLVAPDGLVMSRWYKFGVFNPIGLRLFKSYTTNPGLAISIANTCKWLNIISAKQHRLFEMNATNVSARNNLFTQWLAYRNMEISNKELRSIIEANRTKTQLIMGEYDGIIKAEWAIQLKAECTHIRVDIVRSGHNLLHNKLNELWTSTLI